MFPVVPVFRGLVRRRGLGGVRHGGQVVGHGDAARNDALHGRWYASRRDAHHPGGIPGGRDTESLGLSRPRVLRAEPMARRARQRLRRKRERGAPTFLLQLFVCWFVKLEGRARS